MGIVVPLFLWSDLERIFHYMQKKWVAKGAKKVRIKVIHVLRIANLNTESQASVICDRFLIPNLFFIYFRSRSRRTYAFSFLRTFLLSLFYSVLELSCLNRLFPIHTKSTLHSHLFCIDVPPCLHHVTQLCHSFVSVASYPPI